MISIRDPKDSTGRLRGVSPVVGVILMVAITVILAAVLAAFVMGLNVGNEFQSAAVDVTVTEGGDQIVKVMDIGNADRLRVECGDATMTLTGVGQKDHLRGDCSTITVIGVGEDTESVIHSIDVDSVKKVPGSVANSDAPTSDPTCADELEGEGTSTDPYILTNDHELQCMNEHRDSDLYWALGNDIDASNTDQWNGGDGFTPIGEGTSGSSTRFEGTLDGRNHQIKGLTIKRSSEDETGLFGSTAGEIRNLHVVNADVEGATRVGLIAGRNYGTLENVHAEGRVTGRNVGTEESRVGGVAGQVWGGEITQSTANVDVTGETWTGGLAGQVASSSVIKQSSAASTVTGTTSTGGLVGTLSDSSLETSSASGSVIGTHSVGGLSGKGAGDITESYSTASVESSSAEAGGLVGYVSPAGDIQDSYARGDVTGSDYVGGLVGLLQGDVTATYATGSVSGDSYVGGLIGDDNNNNVVDSYWLTTSAADSDGGTALTHDEMTGDTPQEDGTMDFDWSIWTTTTSYPNLQNVE